MGRLTSLSLTLLTVIGLSLPSPPSTLAQSSFQILPTTAKLAPVGGGSTSAFLIRNTTQELLALEISFLARQIDLDGNESTAPAEDDFLVYPPQILLRPGESQTVRITWVGDPQPSQSLAYWMLTAQVPIDLSQENQSALPPAQPVEGIRVVLSPLFNHQGAIYIVPPGASPKVVLQDVSYQKGENGQEQLVIMLENLGTAHQLLRNFQITVNSEGASITLTEEDLKGLSGRNILPGNKRRFVLPWPKELPVGPVTATFTTN
jgi:fimbrial chaperone protein